MSEGTVRLTLNQWADVIACIELQRRRDSTIDAEMRHGALAVELIRQIQAPKESRLQRWFG